MSVINTNVKALVSQESMRSNNLKLSTTMERLSTGLRINSAKDDAAGLAISNRMTAQIRGFSMAIKNANDGISMAQTADGAYGQVTSMLQRMRELAVQAANGAMTTSDRESIQLEIDELKAEVDNIASQTNFNGIKLLDGSARDVKLQTGVFENDMISVGFSSVKANEIGSGDVPALTSHNITNPSQLSAGDLLINGVQVGNSLLTDDSLSYDKTGSAISVAAAINRVSDQSGVYAKVNETTVLGATMATTATAVASNTVTINGYTTNSFSLHNDTGINRETVVTAINNMSEATGVVAVNTGDDSRGIILVAKDGRNISLATSAGATSELTGLKNSGTTTATYQATYSLYSLNGSSITLDENAGGNIQKVGLRQGEYESNKASFVTRERAVASAVPSTSNVGVLTGSTLKINGVSIDASKATDDDASYWASGVTALSSGTQANSAIAIAAAINRTSDQHGVTAKAEANILRGDGTFTQADGAGAAGTAAALVLNGVSITNFGGTRDAIMNAINEYQGRTGVRAESWGSGMQLVADDGRNISISLSEINDENLGLNGLTMGTSATDAHVHYSTVSLTSDKAFTIERGSEGTASNNFENLGFREGTFGGSDTGVKVAEIDVTTQLGAGIAITAIDAAIEDVARAQSRSGAFQNRLESIVSVLSESSENTSASRSRILDTDYAAETTALAKAQIVQQAATAMLAQANQQAQSVLALLQ